MGVVESDVLGLRNSFSKLIVSLDATVVKLSTTEELRDIDNQEPASSLPKSGAGVTSPFSSRFKTSKKYF